MVGKVTTGGELEQLVGKMRTIGEYYLNVAYWSGGDIMLSYRCDRPWMLLVRCEPFDDLVNTLEKHGKLVHSTDGKSTVGGEK